MGIRLWSAWLVDEGTVSECKARDEEENRIWARPDRIKVITYDDSRPNVVECPYFLDNVCQAHPHYLAGTQRSEGDFGALICPYASGTLEEIEARLSS